ncbi:adenosine deaminase [Meridianimarinicoccus sp. RP-17]|uniref:adenosine deaminase n=1 Tax=Meridianimarinicoccus zhengii TaxID=2056810 RepID=UPI000DAD20B6|nr:adenosine deaminase [Phycocomes zhengii]
MIPKVELHLHVEGAAPSALIRDLAQRQGTDLTGVFAEDGGYAFRDFWHFLKVYEAATSVLRTPGDYHRLVTAVLEAQAAESVIYTEHFLSPDFCGGGDLTAWRDYVAAMADAAAGVAAQGGPRLRGVVTAVRHLGPDSAKRAARCAAETAGEFITGFGLAGDERAGVPRDFAYAFDMAREAGLGLTAHAGEWDGPRSVSDALDDLRVSRIGHGVRAIEDAALVERLARDGIVLEVCPGSNIALGLYPDWSAHPVARLRDAGVPVCLSTDDPSFFRTRLGWEYDRLAAAFGWTEADFAAMNRTAMAAAFCDVATRAEMTQRLEPADDRPA